MTGASADSKALSFTHLDASYLAETKALLQNNGLPFEDCGQHIENFIGVLNAQQLIGMGGIEVHGEFGLLRSVAVDKSAQGQGFGSAVVEYLHQQARSKKLSYLYLLTETAESYFLALGYEKQTRNDLPVEIKSTEQFQSLCPASAQAMRFRL